jgi:hypothetical protein
MSTGAVCDGDLNCTHVAGRAKLHPTLHSAQHKRGDTAALTFRADELGSKLEYRCAEQLAPLSGEPQHWRVPWSIQYHVHHRATA